MQTTLLRSFCIVVSLIYCGRQVFCSFNDVTNKVGVSSVDGILAAFGDFNGDKSTDIFVLTNQEKQLSVYLWNEGSQKFDKSSTFVKFPSRIVNVAPGDFDGDGCMDVVITTDTGTLDSNNIQPKKVQVFWGNHEGFTSMSKSFTLSADLKDQPAIVDVNGDLLPDLFGTNYNKNNASMEERMYWVSMGKNRSFTATRQPINVTSHLDPLRIPHANAFLDVSGDMTADLFVTSQNKKGKKHFEIWENKEGTLVHSRIVDLPKDVRGKVFHVGQSAFADFDGDGKIDHLLPVCVSKNCKESELYLYSKNKWSRILVNHPKIWQFIPPDSNKSYSNIPLMTLRIGDYNMDGYPDGLIILDIFTQADTMISRVPVLLENVPCSSGDSCVNGRTFLVQWKSFTSLNGSVVATFFDLFENGITDFMVATQGKNGKFSLHVIKNNLYVDASFVKIVVLGGVTLESCTGDKLPYGVNQAGPYIAYSMTDNDGNLKTGAAAQLSQSGYFALQCPYIVFGLGRTPNFVDKLTIGMPRARGSPVRRHTWPAIIPNSQMIIIPYPPDKPDEWKSKLLVTPSKLVLLTALCLLGLCAVLAVIIMILHLIEKRADQKEKREDAHKFHFDAM